MTQGSPQFFFSRFRYSWQSKTEIDLEKVLLLPEISRGFYFILLNPKTSNSCKWSVSEQVKMLFENLKTTTSIGTNESLFTSLLLPN